jgi:hypothetical protein
MGSRLTFHIQRFSTSSLPKSSKIFRRRQSYGVTSQAALAQFAEIAVDLKK